MLLAIAVAMTDKGYVGTTVADVLKGAGVSRETFYQQFSSKLDCFMSAFDSAGELLLARLDEAAGGADGTPSERFASGLSAYIDVLAEQPALARVFLVEVYAAGPEALARRAALQTRIIDRVAYLASARTPEDRFGCQLLVAGVSSLVTAPVVAGDVRKLRRLRDQVIDIAPRLVPALRDT